MLTDRQTKTFRGIAFAEFKTNRDAQRYVAHRKGTNVRKAKVCVSLYLLSLSLSFPLSLSLHTRDRKCVSVCVSVHAFEDVLVGEDHAVQ